MKQNLLVDISRISLIKASIFDKLKDIAESCICDYLYEAKILDDDLIEIDIGIGKISILILNDSLEFKFRPSMHLEKSLVKSLQKNSSVLVKEVENGLESKLLSTYKELF